MAVIDEKGRIFGKLNIIDILAVVIIIAAAVVLIGKVMGNRGGEAPAMNMTYTVKVYNVDEDVYRALEKMDLPDQLMASGKLLDGRVESITGVAAEGDVIEIVPNDEGNLTIQRGINAKYDVTFRINAYIPDRVSNELGTQEIRVGKEHIVKTANFEFEHGIILSCEWFDANANPDADAA